MTFCDHTPEGELRGHLELWKTNDGGWTAIAFVRPELMPEVVAHVGADDPHPLYPLEVAAEHLADSTKEMDDLIDGARQ